MDDKQLQRMINSNWTLRQYNLTRQKTELYSGFTVGDFVTEKNGTKYTENIVGSGLKARFKIVYKDPNSKLTFAQRINMDGKMGKPFCLEGRVSSVFELDANYVTAQLVADNYDPDRELKETQQRVSAVKKANAKLFTRFNDAHVFAKYITEKMKVGFQFWLSYSTSTTTFHGPYTVTSVDVKKLKGGYSWKPYGFDAITNLSITIKTQDASGHPLTWTADSLYESYKISESQPQSLKVAE